MAALESEEEGPDPRQQVRVRCWGEGLFKSSGDSQQADPASNPAADAAVGSADSVRSSDSQRLGPASNSTADGGGIPATGSSGEAAEANGHLINLYQMAACQCYMALEEAEQFLVDGSGATAVRRLQVRPFL